MTDFHSLTVAKTVSHIDGFAKTLQFLIPADIASDFIWEAGQYVIIELTIDKKTVKRAYTISNSPHCDKPLQITIKRTREGLVSNYVNENIEAGDVVKVSEPLGQFQLIPDKTKARQHYFFAAGSGITPMMAMIETALLAEPQSRAYLLYGNRNDQTVIFRDELAQLAKAYPERFHLAHAFSSPREEAGYPFWRTGRINAEMLAELLKEHPIEGEVHCYICGPGSMNDDCRESLQILGIDNVNIHTESFVENVIKPDVKSLAAKTMVVLDDEVYKVDIKPNQTLLSAFRQARIDPPFSCKSGTCGDCQATLTKGEVFMHPSPALSQSEREDGEILTCQSFAQTTSLKVVFED